jgi:tetratricopeptide (TPR) repeat protein
MKNGKNLILVVALFASTFVFGQDYTFKVLANKGTNEVKSGDTWQAVKTGSSLKAGDELKISDNAYLGLVHSSGKPVELKTAGNYKVADLASKVGGGTTVLNKYTDFILSSNSAEAKKNRLSATGAVHRGLEDIKVYLPENQNSGIYNNIAIINWESDKAKGPYIVALKNMFDDELMKIETPEATAQIDLNDPKFANESAILLEVKSKADSKSKSEQHLIKKLSAADREKVKKSMSTEIPAEVVNSETPLSKLLLASFYEQNKLYIDAITAYEQAIKLAPDVPTYREDYEEFLLRNKFKAAK